MNIANKKISRNYYDVDPTNNKHKDVEHTASLPLKTNYPLAQRIINQPKNHAEKALQSLIALRATCREKGLLTLNFEEIEQYLKQVETISKNLSGSRWENFQKLLPGTTSYKIHSYITDTLKFLQKEKENLIAQLSSPFHNEALMLLLNHPYYAEHRTQIQPEKFQYTFYYKIEAGQLKIEPPPSKLQQSPSTDKTLDYSNYEKGLLNVDFSAYTPTPLSLDPKTWEAINLAIPSNQRNKIVELYKTLAHTDRKMHEQELPIIEEEALNFTKDLENINIKDLSDQKVEQLQKDLQEIKHDIAATYSSKVWYWLKKKLFTSSTVYKINSCTNKLLKALQEEKNSRIE